jgi:hypothetical protein
MGELRNTYKIFVENLKEGSSWNTYPKLGDNIKMDFIEIVLDFMDLINLM